MWQVCPTSPTSTRSVSGTHAPTPAVGAGPSVDAHSRASRASGSGAGAPQRPIARTDLGSTISAGPGPHPGRHPPGRSPPDRPTDGRPHAGRPFACQGRTIDRDHDDDPGGRGLVPDMSAPIRLGANCWNQYTDWDGWMRAIQRADAAGYDSLWTWDHLYPIVGSWRGPSSRPTCTSLAAAALTQRGPSG